MKNVLINSYIHFTYPSDTLEHNPAQLCVCMNCIYKCNEVIFEYHRHLVEQKIHLFMPNVSIYSRKY